MKKRLMLILVTVVLCFSLFACGNKAVDPVAQRMISDIEALGEIELDDAAQIEKLVELYATLTDEQKNQVSNYIDLIDAQDKIEELREEYHNELMAEIEERKHQEPENFLIPACQMIKNGLKNPNSLQIAKISFTDILDDADKKKYGFDPSIWKAPIRILYFEIGGENSMGGMSSSKEYGYMFYGSDDTLTKLYNENIDGNSSEKNMMRLCRDAYMEALLDKAVYSYNDIDFIMSCLD